MGFLEAYDAIAAQGGDPSTVAAAQMALFNQQLDANPKGLFDDLRNNRPNFVVVPGMICVTQFDDVEEVITRDEFFSVQLYQPKMDRLSGPFVLAMDNTPTYSQFISILRLAFRREDGPRLVSLSGDIADKLIADAQAEGTIDLWKLGQLAPLRMVEQYYGVPGPDEATLLRWADDIFQDVFHNSSNDQAITDKATVAGQEMCTYLDQLIAERRASFASGGPAPTDVIGRLVHMQSDPSTNLADDQIRSQIIGTITGTVDTTARAILGAFQTFFEQPEQMAGAIAAAESGNDALLSAYIWEAMRFHPQNTIIPRLCSGEYTVAKGTNRELTIPAGAVVFAANFSAMFDSGKVDAPDEFRTNRPSSNYIHFGYAQHRCLGEYISQVQLRETIKRLLKLKNLQKAAGSDAQPVALGNLPTEMTITFDPGDAP